MHGVTGSPFYCSSIRKVWLLITFLILSKLLSTKSFWYLLVICQLLKNSWVCNGIVYPCTQLEDWYICTDGQTIYLQDHMDQTPSLANNLLPTMPRGPASWPRYMEFCPFHGHTTYMSVSTSTSSSTAPHLCCHCNCHNHTAMLWDHPVLHMICHSDPRHRHRKFRWSPFSIRFNSQFSI